MDAPPTSQRATIPFLTKLLACLLAINIFVIGIVAYSIYRSNLWTAEMKMILILATLFLSGSWVAGWIIYHNRMRELRADALHRNTLEEAVRVRTAELRKFSITMDRLSDAVHWVSKNGRFLYVNDAACKLHGLTREKLLTMSVADVGANSPPEAWPSRWESLKREGRIIRETTTFDEEGNSLPVEVTENYINFDGYEFDCGIVRDISESKKAESERQKLMVQISQAQRMDSIGYLAGGIAHDFNNLLTPILGYARMIREFNPPDDKNHIRAERIMQAADKAKILTQQLLSFGRMQILEMKTININDVVTRFYEILRRTIRENIEIQLNLTDGTYGVRADKNQIEQIIMNLVINAQDAISNNGLINIDTLPVTFDDDNSRHHVNVKPGHYLMLAVSDTGAGMDEETVSHIFEPFFTTKEIGKGSGLGLATVYGIVKQHDGYIWVYSEKGRGTIFKIYFPIVAAQPIPDVIEMEYSDATLTGCNILVVEDNEMVKNLLFDLLTNRECNVLMAGSPKEALEISKRQTFNLLLTDVIMPDINGPELYQRLLKTHPGLKVLYMSGYTNNVIAHHGILDDGINIILKPFSQQDLIKKINFVMAQGGEQHNGDGRCH